MDTATNNPIGTEIAREFGRAVNNYHHKAGIQRKVADGLIASLKPWSEIILPGPVLEVGCGTGFLTELILNEYPDREFVITDASSQMLSFTKNRLGEADNVRYELLDAEQLEQTGEKYALIVSNFAVQWLPDAAIGLEKLSQRLLPGGLLVVTFPGNHSFEEWYECCLELGLPFTANPLPDVENVVIKLSLGPVQIDYYENDLYQQFDSSMDFFRHIKEIGAGKSKTGKHLSPKQLKLLTNFWDQKNEEQVKVKWHIVYLAAKKDLR